MLNIIIAGTRTYNNYNQFKLALFEIFPKLQWGYLVSKAEMKIFSGNANGADKMGERFGRDFGIPVVLYPAKWDDLTVSIKSIKKNSYGKDYNALAGFQRNEKMRIDAIKEDGVLIAFWDGKSPGTKEMITECEKLDIRIFVVRI